MPILIASTAVILSNGVPMLNVAIESESQVTVDRGNLIRRTCTLVCTDADGSLVNSGLLTPYGNEIAVYYGTTFWDGTTELILQGIFEITEVDKDDTTADLVITIDGSDRAILVQRDAFTDVYTIPPNTNIGLAIQGVILSRSINPLAMQFNFAPTAFTTGDTPIVFQPGDDPWAAVADPQDGLAASIGMELFYDPNGVCTMIPIRDPTTAPISWPYDEGPSNIATEVEPISSNTSGYNAVIVQGTSTGGDLVSSTYPHGYDTNPASKTWIGGDYGVVSTTISSSAVFTVAQANVMADAQLALNLGTVEQINLGSIVVPDFDVDTVIEVTRVRVGIASGSLYVLDSFTIGFGTDGILQAVGRFVT